MPHSIPRLQRSDSARRRRSVTGRRLRGCQRPRDNAGALNITKVYWNRQAAPGCPPMPPQRMKSQIQSMGRVPRSPCGHYRIPPWIRLVSVAAAQNPVFSRRYCPYIQYMLISNLALFQHFWISSGVFAFRPGIAPSRLPSPADCSSRRVSHENMKPPRLFLQRAGASARYTDLTDLACGACRDGGNWI